MAKSQEKTKARKLRQKGESIKVISRQLGVSPGSVSLWTRDIMLTFEQTQALEKRRCDPNYGNRLKYSLAQRKKSEKKTQLIRRIGIREVGELSKRELFLAGVSLYWAEGFKKDRQVGFASSDPQMIRFFLNWLYICCGCKQEDLILRVTANIDHQYRVNEIQNYWLDLTGVNKDCFRKPFYQKTKWKKVYDHPEEYYGVLRVRVRKSSDFLRKIHGWIEGLKGQPITLVN